MKSRKQPSLPGFPDIPEKLEVRIPSMPQWKQIGGDMSPGAHGGLIAKSDGDALELIEIQPVRAYIGDREAAEVGFPFWTKEAYFDLSDLDPSNEDVQSALATSGFTEGEQKFWFEEEATPEQRALVIAEALVSYGRADEGPAGWSSDIIHDKVKWQDGTIAGAEYIADEDEEFARDVLLDNLDVDYEKYGPDEKNPTSGLKVEASSRGVEITEWTDIEDANGEEQPEGERISRQDANIDLSELFDPNAKHRGTYSGDDKSVGIVELAKMNDDEREDAIVSAAIAYLGYWGGEESYVDAIGE